MNEEKDRPDEIPENGVQTAPEGEIDVGARLREAREARGMSPKEAAAALKLSSRQIVALEANDWTQWPRTITRGFVRNYARLLDIDAAPLMAALDGMPPPSGPELPVAVGSAVDMPGEERGDRRDWVRVGAGLLALILAILAYLFVPAETWRSGFDSIQAFFSEKRAVQTSKPASPAAAPGETRRIAAAPPARPATEPTPAPAASAPTPAPAVTPAPTASTPAPGETAVPHTPPAILQPAAPDKPPADSSATPGADALTPAPGESASSAPGDAPAASPGEETSKPAPGDALAFSFTAESWVEVRDADGKVIFSRLNPAGTMQEVSGRPPFKLVIGNASQVSLRYKGRLVDLSKRGANDVARLTVE